MSNEERIQEKTRHEGFGNQNPHREEVSDRNNSEFDLSFSVPLEDGDPYTCTKAELIHLIKFWTDVALSIEFGFFFQGYYDRSESNTRNFAYERIDEIAKVVGREETQQVYDEEFEKFGEGIDKRTWFLFKEGHWDVYQNFDRNVDRLMASKSESGKEDCNQRQREQAR